MASNRSQAVQYITWGILLVIGALILLLTKFLASNPIIAFIIGGALIVRCSDRKFSSCPLLLLLLLGVPLL